MSRESASDRRLSPRPPPSSPPIITLVTGSSLLFFGFIGFDEVCCLAAKSHNPRRTMPLAIAGTLGGAAVLSMLAQLALSGMTPYTDDMGATSFEDSFKVCVCGGGGFMLPPWLGVG